MGWSAKFRHVQRVRTLVLSFMVVEDTRIQERGCGYFEWVDEVGNELVKMWRDIMFL